MFYGQHFHAGPGTWVKPETSANLHRLWDVDARISWDAIDQPGGYFWADLDWRVAVARECGAQVAYVVGITPQRLRTSTVADGHNIPGAASFPSDLAPFRAFIKALANRYPAAVMPIIEPPNEWVAPGFNRTPAYLKLMTDIIREEAPDRIVPSPSFFAINDMAAYFAEDKTCDAINVHWYGQDAEMLRRNLQSLDDIVADLGVKTRDGKHPPVWLSEFGWRLDQQKAPDWPIASMTTAQIAADVVGGTFDVLKERDALGGCWYSWDANRPDILLSMGDKPELIAAMQAAINGGAMPAPTKPTYPARPTNPTSEQLNNWLRECEELSRQYGNDLTAYGQANYLTVNAADVTTRQANTAAQTALAAANQALATAAANGSEVQALTMLAASFIDQGKTPAEAAALAKTAWAAIKPRPPITFPA